MQAIWSTEQASEVVRLAVSAFGGATVGLERQWSGHATGAAARLGGLRTFTLLGALGGFAGLLESTDHRAMGSVLLAAGSALVLLGYLVASRHDVDATTEVAALVVMAAGFLAGVGRLQIASGTIAVTTLLLAEKPRLHALVTRLDDTAFRAGVRFAVMAIVVLPLLPVGPLDPYGLVRPRELWALVLFFSGLSFVGYVARRAVSPRHGYPLAGLFGGLVSSTNVTLTFARLSRASTDASLGLAVGAVAASTLVFPRVVVATFVLNPPLVLSVAMLVAIPFVIGLGVTAWGLARNRESDVALEPMHNPLQFTAALQMAGLFQLVLVGMHVVRGLWGGQGVIASAALLGLTDVDALTIAMARSAANGLAAPVAAQAIAVGVLSNMVVKLGILSLIGRGLFRRVAAVGLIAMAAALAASLALIPL
jgi:uncharacterized membrane protein (DUF4010 family)